MMNIGQNVLLICRVPHDYPDWPPIGAIGYVVRGLDEWGDYEVMFDGYPWIGNDVPTWEIPKGWVIPVDDIKANKNQEVELIEVMSE